MNYTLHQLQIFTKVVDFKSITKASKELHLTQPAVSIQLKKFQEQFDQPLTEVVSRQLYITDFGMEIAAAAKTILREVEALQYKTKTFNGEISGKLKIAIVSTAKYMMPYFLTDFMKKNKSVDLIMDVTNKSSVIESLLSNTVDFAMVSVIPDNMNIEKIQLMQNKLYLVGGKQYEHRGKFISKKRFESLPLIYREKGSATRNAMEEYVREHLDNTQMTMELTSNEALKQAVIAGLGYSIMPLIGIKHALNDHDLQIIPAKKLPIVTNWHLIWMKSKNLTPVGNAFTNYLIKNKENIIKSTFDWFEKY